MTGLMIATDDVHRVIIFFILIFFFQIEQKLSTSVRMVNLC